MAVCAFWLISALEQVDCLLSQRDCDGQPWAEQGCCRLLRFFWLEFINCLSLVSRGLLGKVTRSRQEQLPGTAASSSCSLQGAPTRTGENRATGPAAAELCLTRHVSVAMTSNSSAGNSSSSVLSDLFLLQSRRFFASIYFLIFLLGMPGNVLLLLVLIPDFMRTGASHVSRLTGPLLVNIALLDLLFFLYVVPVMFGNVLFEGWPLGYVVCVTYNSLSLSIIFADFYSLLAVSLLRYVAVIHPTRTMAVSQRLIAWVCMFIWMLGFLFSIPLWIHYTTVEVEGETYCVNQMPKQQLALYFRLVGGLAFLPPMLLMILCYSSIIFTLWVRRGLTVHTASSLQVNRRATVMALVTVMTFVVMWVPYWLVVFLTKDDELLTTGPMYLASNLTTLLAYANRCVNPIICFSLSSQYQAGLRKLVRRTGCCLEPGCSKDTVRMEAAGGEGGAL